MSEDPKDLLLQLSGDLFISIDVENPIARALFEREALLFDVALPIFMGDLASELSADRERLVG